MLKKKKKNLTIRVRSARCKKSRKSSGARAIQNDERGPGEPFHRKITFVNRTGRIEQEEKEGRGNQGERVGKGMLVSAERNSHLSTFGAYRIISCRIFWFGGNLAAKGECEGI